MKKTYSALSLSLFLILLTAPVQAAPAETSPKTSPARSEQMTATLYTSVNTQTLEALMQSEGYSVTVDKDGDLVVINVDYEVRNNLFSNVDTVVHFKHKYEMKGK